MPSNNLGLNPTQIEAVKHNEGPALVLAGPGSGKTRVLTTRIARLIEQNIAHPSQIIAITFTNKAASEMKERVKVLTKDYGPQWVGTFHSICAKILRFDGSAIGIENNFNIYDTDDSISIIKKVYKDLSIDPKKFNPHLIFSLISSAKTELIDNKEYKKYAKTQNQTIASSVYDKYQKHLANSNALDFSDLIFKTVELFEKSEETLEKYNNKFTYVLVDEYQDTNRAQYVLSKLLSKKTNNIFVVGDMAQAIYSWRGADYRNIVNFKNDYNNTKVYNLNQNYRSTKVIIEASKSVIKNNKTNINLDLWTQNTEGDKIDLFEGSSEKEEADYIVKQIFEENLNYDQTAVLYRTNAQSRAVEEALIKSGIPYKIFGGTKFYQRKEIKDILSFLRVLNNPKDSVSWERIINIPPKGIGIKTFQKISEANFDLDLIKEKTNIDYQKLIEKSKSTPVYELIEYIMNNLEYLNYLKAQPEEKERIESRIENVNELKTVAKEFNNLPDFLENAALVEGDNEDEEGSKVTLMTIHSAKGLEFKNIFIIGLEEGIFPHSRSLNEREQLEEERRLCYVAITRAKTKLYLTLARRRSYFGSVSSNPPSRFISEIPEHLINKQNLFKPAVDNNELESFFDNMGI